MDGTSRTYGIGRPFATPQTGTRYRYATVTLFRRRARAWAHGPVDGRPQHVTTPTRRPDRYLVPVVSAGGVGRIRLRRRGAYRRRGAPQRNRRGAAPGARGRRPPRRDRRGRRRPGPRLLHALVVQADPGARARARARRSRARRPRDRLRVAPRDRRPDRRRARAPGQGSRNRGRPRGRATGGSP